MRAGNSWINAHNVFPHGVPYGGIGKSGLGGGVNSVETLFDYWRSVSVVRPAVVRDAPKCRRNKECYDRNSGPEHV